MKSYVYKYISIIKRESIWACLVTQMKVKHWSYVDPADIDSNLHIQKGNIILSLWIRQNQYAVFFEFFKNNTEIVITRSDEMAFYSDKLWALICEMLKKHSKDLPKWVT